MESIEEDNAGIGGSALAMAVTSPVSALKQDRIPGSQNPTNFPDIVYKEDGTAVRSIDIDEGQLDLKPSIGPKGKFVNFTEDDGTKTRYYYKPPAGSRDKQIEKQGENIDEVD